MSPEYVIVKSIFHTRNVFDINLADLTAKKILKSYDNTGDFLVVCADSSYAYFKEALCYVSNFMKKFVREHPERNFCVLAPEYDRVALWLQNFVYRKYSPIRLEDKELFLQLLQEMKIAYEVVDLHKFYDFSSPEFSMKFMHRIYRDAGK